jgi:hypothetical protein
MARTAPTHLTTEASIAQPFARSKRPAVCGTSRPRCPPSPPPLVVESARAPATAQMAAPVWPARLYPTSGLANAADEALQEVDRDVQTTGVD